MSICNNSKVSITPITKTPGTGELIPGVSFTQSVYLENETEMMKAGNGRDSKSNILCMINYPCDIKTGYLIQITDRFGAAVVEPERTVITAPLYGGGSPSHYEVMA